MPNMPTQQGKMPMTDRFYQILPFLCGLLAIFLIQATARAKDVVTITSDKTAVVDKSKGTAIWRKNVHLVRLLTGSNLLTDKLSVERDLKSKRIIWAEADGNVKAYYFRPMDGSVEDPTETGSKEYHLHTTITCDYASYSRNTSLAELKGSVHVKSVEGTLDAEKIRYHTVEERGHITAKRGEQVQFVFFKKSSSKENSTTNAQTEQQPVSGRADEIRLDRKARKAVLQGNVYVINRSDLSEFNSNRADLFFDEQEEIDTIIASGQFSMKQPGRISRADRAVFEYKTEEVTLIGNAYVKEKEDMEVTSARIKMYIKVNKGIISGVDDVPVKMKIEIE